jgi:hypothetical protein
MMTWIVLANDSSFLDPTSENRTGQASRWRRLVKCRAPACARPESHAQRFAQKVDVEQCREALSFVAYATLEFSPAFSRPGSGRHIKPASRQRRLKRLTQSSLTRRDSDRLFDPGLEKAALDSPVAYATRQNFLT